MTWSLLRNDIVSFWFWGYRGDLRIELQAPVIILAKSYSMIMLLLQYMAYMRRIQKVLSEWVQLNSDCCFFLIFF